MWWGRGCHRRVPPCSGSASWGLMEEVIGDKWRALSIILIGSSAPWSPAHSGPSGAVSEIKFLVSRLFFVFVFVSLVYFSSFLSPRKPCLFSYVLRYKSKSNQNFEYFLSLHFYSCILYFFPFYLVSSLFPTFARNRQILNSKMNWRWKMCLMSVVQEVNKE